MTACTSKALSPGGAEVVTTGVVYLGVDPCFVRKGALARDVVVERDDNLGGGRDVLLQVHEQLEVIPARHDANEACLQADQACKVQAKTRTGP